MSVREAGIVDEDFSNEGLYRLLKDMKDEHGADLKDIRKQTTLTNSRVDKLETRTDRNDQELKRINAAVFQRRSTDRETAAGESFSLSGKVSPKLWVALAAALGILWSQGWETFKQWLAKP